MRARGQGQLRLAAVLAMACAAIFAGMLRANAETLVAALSQETVFIRSNFTGASLTLFGSIERDASTVARRQGYDVVTIVRGPDEWPVVRRKDRFSGIWLNRDAMRFRSVPTYYAVQSNRSLSLIADPQVLSRYGIGLTHIDLQPVEETLEAERLVFATALVRLRLANGLFSEAPSGVSFLTERVFSTRIRLPSNIHIGPYRVEMYLFRDGALLARETLHFGVRKTGLESLLSETSRNQPVVYGLGAVAIAILLGWLAGLMFRQS
ncbi:MAG: TIGR02186 family protein [Rhodobiaceae bacterium]|nr:TIGR02186 family protein [Rhodobiaceae bacterium]MCC0015739.1 TIGR02186 family protein [Rhodobiaceae bacterium]MCC0053998.1 TIGR02186 family protein [Rhodobiaceae bacterium]